VLGITAEHKSDIPRGKGRSDVGDAFVQEVVMTQIRARVERYRRKKRNHRLFEMIRGFNGHI